MSLRRPSSNHNHIMTRGGSRDRNLSVPLWSQMLIGVSEQTPGDLALFHESGSRMYDIDVKTVVQSLYSHVGPRMYERPLSVIRGLIQSEASYGLFRIFSFVRIQQVCICRLTPMLFVHKLSSRIEGDLDSCDVHPCTARATR